MYRLTIDIMSLAELVHAAEEELWARGFDPPKPAHCGSLYGMDSSDKPEVHDLYCNMLLFKCTFQFRTLDYRWCTYSVSQAESDT